MSFSLIDIRVFNVYNKNILFKKQGVIMRQFKCKDFFIADETVNILKTTATIDEQSHTHEFVELVYVMSGNGTHYINYKSYPVKRGDLLFINYNQVHSFIADKEMTYVNFLMKPEFMSSKLISCDNIFDIFAISLFDESEVTLAGNRPIVHFSGQDMIDVEAIIQSMLNECHEKQTGYKSIINGYMLVLFSKFTRGLEDLCSNDIHTYINRITPEIIEYIDENYSDPITLKEIAEKCFYNASYFSRIFKKCYGRNLTDYIQEKRMNEAIKLLQETNLTVEKICSDVGYSDKKQFYKLFKTYTGYTPNLYRKNRK